MFLSVLRYPLILFALASWPMPSWGQSDIVFLSDTQEPMWVEKIVLKGNDNVRATGLVFSDITRRKPNALFILGDVVSLGYKSKKWSRIDQYLDSARKSGVAVSALLGNHDVMTRARRGESQFQSRFPNHIRTGYYVVVDSVATVFLNSNFKKLSKEDITAQKEWLVSTMIALDKDPAVVVTIVACHHAPYTNSKIVGSSKEVQQYFVPTYLASQKGRLFITGHSHNFEVFNQGGKDFLVIGGGGGLSQPLSKKERRLNDLSGNYKPAFHYVVARRNSKELLLTSCYLKPDFSGFADGYSLTIPLP